jgi:transposase
MNHLRCRAKITLTISEERKKRVIDLYYNQGKTTREIAKIERMSIRDISAILKEEEARRQKYKDQQQKEELSSKAYKLFCEGKRPVEVAIALNLREPEITKMYREYWKLKRHHILNSIFKETNGKLGAFLKLCRLMKEKGMTIEQLANAIEIAIHKLPYMENLYLQAKDQAEKMQRTIQRLANNIRALEYKISILDATAFISEQECRRKEQQLQELTDKKDRLEKFIVNILNGEGYSKLKQIVKAILSENKKLISISFVALIQTIKTDPQLVKLIQNIPSTNDEEHKDNNNIIKYLESNKDRIMDLVEKNYENLVEELTNNTINIAVASSSNPTLSLPQPSSTFPNPFNQGDSHRIEQSYTHHNSKGDIAN